MLRSYRFATLLLVLAVAPASAQIHRWVDDQGVTHFGDRPPARSGAQAVELEVAVPTQADRRAAAARAEVAERRREAQRHEAGRESTLEEGRAIRADACMRSRRRLDVLLQPLRVYEDNRGELHLHLASDTYQGPRHYLDDAARQRAIDLTWRNMHAHCDRPDDPDAQREANRQQVRAEECEGLRSELEAALRPNSRSGDDEIERRRQRVEATCYD